VKGHLRSLVSRAIVKAARVLPYAQPESTIARDSQRYWQDTASRDFRSNSHWRGEGGLPEQDWLALGRQHLELFHQLARLTTLQLPLRRVVEWGCGGGANALHFAAEADEFVGVDVSEASLAQCAATLSRAGIHGFVPVLIDVAHPEAAVDRVSGPCDLFLCTYVFELIPSPHYGRRLLEIALRLLRPGAVALVQIKYATDASSTRSRRWGYKLWLASMTSFPIDAFWELAERVGFRPITVTLQPVQPLVRDERYAYFLLEKPRGEAASTSPPA
jgi:SAM-dependent methyltransferase